MNYEEKRLEDLPIGSTVYLQYTAVKRGVKTSIDEVSFEDGGSLSEIKRDTVRAFVKL